jgi:putative peptide zinc metalloprotease protein
MPAVAPPWEGFVQYLILAALVVAGLVIGIDVVRQRRRRRDRPHVRMALASHLATVGSFDVAGALERALADLEPAEPMDSPEGVWDAVDLAVDLEAFRPKLAAGTEIVTFHLRWGEDYAMAASPDRSTHYAIEPWEAELARSMDGSRSVGELIVEHLNEGGDLDPGAVVGLVDTLWAGGLLDPVPTDVMAAVRNGLDPSSSGRKKLRRFGRELTIGWDGAEAFATRLYRGGLRYAFTPVGFALLAIVAIGGLAAFVTTVVSHRFVLVLRQPPAEAAILITLAFVLTFFHELAHALVLIRYDRRVLSAGFFIFFGSPAFFVEATDVMMLDKAKRIQQSFAGPFAELVLAGAASAVILLAPGAAFAPLLYRFAFVNYLVILENLIPLLQLDGYWILSDFIEIPDLRPRSIAFVQRDLWRKVFRWERLSVQEVGLALYGIVGVVFTAFAFALGIFFWQQIFGGLISSLWRGGPFSRLLLVVLILLFTGPVIRGAIALTRAIMKRVRARWRRVRFRFERSWRVEAAELIDALPVFDDLPAEVLSDLAGRIRLRTCPPERAVFRQGDRPEAFYVVRRGRVRVEEEDPDTGQTRTLRTLERGSSFGEIGLLETTVRRASVVAETSTELFEVSKSAFERLLADSIHAPTFAPTMQAYAELRELTPFRTASIEAVSVLLEHGSWRTYPPGDVIVRRGERGDAFYVIGAGQVEVERDGRRVATLGRGDHFGELALLQDTPRNANVTTIAPTRAFRLDREGFEAVVAESLADGFERPEERTMEH